MVFRGPPYIFYATSSDGAHWQIRSNLIYEEQQRVRQGRQVADQKASLRTMISTKFGITKFISDQELMANPFIFKDTTVGVYSIFSQMLSENEAVFVWKNPIVVSGVPTTRFQGHEGVILGIRVKGNKQVKIPTFGGNTDMAVPFAEYVGDFKCRTDSCSEYFE